MTRPAAFTQGDISKILKAAQAAGQVVTRVEIDRFGHIVALFGKQEDDRQQETELDRIIRAQREQAPKERQRV